MPIEHHKGGTMITGRGDMPEGGMSFYTLLHAHQAMKMHVGGKMRMTRASLCGPGPLCDRLNQEYPNRPEGPFKSRRAKGLLKEIEAEVQRQKDLHKASLTSEQLEAFDRILNES
jgi:hypothetical protein